MANRTRPTLEKRNKERARQEKRKHKDERRANAKVQRANTPRLPGEEDPDIAGIVPGPQASPFWAKAPMLSHLFFSPKALC